MVLMYSFRLLVNQELRQLITRVQQRLRLPRVTQATADQRYYFKASLQSFLR